MLSLTVAAVTSAQVALRDDFRLPSARYSALGGIHAADAEDLYTLFANPAGFVSVEPQFSFSKLGIRLTGPVFTLSSVVVEGLSSDLTALLTSDRVSALLQSLYASSDVVGPIHFGYVGGGLGFGVFNATALDARTVGSSTISASVSERLVLQGGYAFSIPLATTRESRIDVGVLLKGLIKGESLLDVSVFALPSFMETLGGDVLQSVPFAVTSGIGLDIGVRYALGRRLGIGLVGHDAFSPTVVSTHTSLQSFLENTGSPTLSYDYVPFDLTAGVSYRPPLGGLERFVDDFALLLDYRDIFDFAIQKGSAPNPLLKLGLGAELTILEILALRGGFNEGLFAAGLGLDLTIMQLDFAMFGSELSPEPGLRPTFNVILGISFGF
jgi:hypothetical protein